MRKRQNSIILRFTDIHNLLIDDQRTESVLRRVQSNRNKLN